MATILTGKPGAASICDRVNRGETRAGRCGAFIQRIATWLAGRNRAFERVGARSRFHIWVLAVLVGLVAVAFVQREAGVPLGIRFDRNRQPVAAVA